MMRSVDQQGRERLSANLPGTAWRTSSRCSHGDCVEVGSAAPAGAVAVRDTKNRGAGPDLCFTPGAWRSFLAGVKQAGIARHDRAARA